MLMKFKLKDGGSRWLNLNHVVHIGPVDKSKQWHHQETPGSPKTPMSPDVVAGLMEVTMTTQNNNARVGGETAVQQESFTVQRTHPSMYTLQAWSFVSRWSPVAAMIVATLALLTSWAHSVAHVCIPTAGA